MWRAAVHEAVTVVSVMEPVDTGNIATPKYSSSFNMWDYPGKRFIAILRAAVSLTGAAANGVTFSIQDTTDSPRDTVEVANWAAKAETAGSLAKLTAIGIQVVSFWPKEGGTQRPWIRIKALSDNNATLYSVSAVILAIAPGA